MDSYQPPCNPRNGTLTRYYFPGQEDVELTSAGSLLPEIGLSHLRVPTRYRPPTWRTRVPLFVWVITFDLSGMEEPTSSLATASIALRIM